MIAHVDYVSMLRPNPFTSAELLNVSSNRFHGSLSTKLGLLTRLEIIDFSVNDMSGSLPSELGRLSDLGMFGAELASELIR